MSKNDPPVAGATRDAVLARVRALIPLIRDNAVAAEDARTLPRQTVDALLAAGICRILIPPRYGGYGLSLDTWFDAVCEVAKADASHGWCASLMIHHPHYVGHFPQAAQDAVWSDGIDFAIAASVQPAGQVMPVNGGYRVSGEFAFASGINHSRWLVVGSIAAGTTGPQARFFLLRPNDYQVKDTWFTTAMRGTGSNTAVCNDVFVPEDHTLALDERRKARTNSFANGRRVPRPAALAGRWRSLRACKCGLRAPPPISTLRNCCCGARSMPPVRRRSRRSNCVRERCAIVRGQRNCASRSSIR
jgi:alkylation response protein AidB-like acyl-CoA dehydrogenase